MYSYIVDTILGITLDVQVVVRVQTLHFNVCFFIIKYTLI